jgi:predicted nucleic acid-binding protein
MTSPSLVVSDTSPLCNLARLGWLDWLKRRFGKVWIPEAVASELGIWTHVEGARLLRHAMEDGWLEIRRITDANALASLPNWIHQGEKEAILLPENLNASYLLMDDRDGRAVAEARHLSVVGEVGMVLWVKESGQIESVTDALRRLREEARFFISPKLEYQAIASAGEGESCDS